MHSSMTSRLAAEFLGTFVLVSGGHFNPAVTLGAVLAGRVEPAAVESGFATNGYGDLSLDRYSLAAVLIAETVLTAIFLYIILGATNRRAPQGFAPVAIGLALTLIHLISIPISNTSVNPARSLGIAVYAGSEPLMQVWAFFVPPRCSVPPSPASPTSSSSRTSRITSWRTSGPLPRSVSPRQVDRRYVP